MDRFSRGREAPKERDAGRGRGSEDDEREGRDEEEAPRGRSRGTREEAPRGGRSSGGRSKSRSPWADVDPSQGGGRTPMPHVGEYLFKLVSLEYGENEESVKASVEILELDKKGEENHRQGDAVSIINKIVGGKGGVAGRMGWARVMAMVMAFAGYSTKEEEDFKEFDADGKLLYDALDGSDEAPTIIGRVAQCRVTKGNDVIDERGNVSDYYRTYSWVVVDDKDELQELKRPDKQ